MLFNGATAYMDVLRDTANLNLQRNNVEVLEEQLRQTRDRFNVGEVTRTDVAQAEARLAQGRSQVSAAEFEPAGEHRPVPAGRRRRAAPARARAPARPAGSDVGRERDLRRAPRAPLDPRRPARARCRGSRRSRSPRASSTRPSGCRGSAQQRWDSTLPGDERFVGSAVATLTVPIYEGGEVYARVRQAKETAGQRRIEADIARDLVRANVVTAWGQLEAAKAQIIASQAQVQAAEVALTGVREEARVGQRTTLDVLNAQQELLTARVNLITAQRDRVVVSYAVVRAMGRLTTKLLALNVAQYRAKEHFDQVKDLWYGVRTPDGR